VGTLNGSGFPLFGVLFWSVSMINREKIELIAELGLMSTITATLLLIFYVLKLYITE
jgi:hypothetical protein